MRQRLPMRPLLKGELVMTIPGANSAANHPLSPCITPAAGNFDFSLSMEMFRCQIREIESEHPSGFAEDAARAASRIGYQLLRAMRCAGHIFSPAGFLLQKFATLHISGKFTAATRISTRRGMVRPPGLSSLRRTSLNTSGVPAPIPKMAQLVRDDNVDLLGKPCAAGEFTNPDRTFAISRWRVPPREQPGAWALRRPGIPARRQPSSPACQARLCHSRDRERHRRALPPRSPPDETMRFESGQTDIDDAHQASVTSYGFLSIGVASE